MSTKISLSLLVITSAFLSAQATNAQNSLLFTAEDSVANNTSYPRFLRTESSPDLIKIESTQMDFDRPQETSPERLASRQMPIVLHPQTNVFASDVATMLQGGSSSNKISATPAPSAWEASVEIPVPPPLTQTIRGVKTNREIVAQPITNSPRVVKIYAKPNPLTLPIAQAPATSIAQPSVAIPTVPASPAAIDKSPEPVATTGAPEGAAISSPE